MPGATEPERGLREAALAVVGRLVDAGHIAYFAGGCVRDRLMGLEPLDYDVATDARPEDIGRLFRSARGVGSAFGVMLVRRDGHTIEVATFRMDGRYPDGRHPIEVHFTDAEHDASRRDFTMNGLFEDPLADEVIDFVGGRADIEARRVRAIGDPAARLGEDQLRMLRAVRFAARFAFAIESSTAEAIQESAAQLRGISRERIGQEIRWMLSDRNRAVAAWELQYLGLDAAALQEPTCLAAPRRLARLPDDVPYPTALAAWMLDRVPDEGDGLPAPNERAGHWSSALMLSGAERGHLSRVLELCETLAARWWSLGIAAQKRIAASDGFADALLIAKAEDPQVFVDIQRRVIELGRTGLAPTPLIDGNDLIAAGFAPGPIFARLLDAVYDAQLEGSIATPSEAIDLAQALRDR